MLGSSGLRGLHLKAPRFGFSVRENNVTSVGFVGSRSLGLVSRWYPDCISLFREAVALKAPGR